MTIERMRAYRKTYVAMLISSTLSLIASLVLSIDAWKLAGNPKSKFACDINAVVSCGKVAKSWQSTLLGFPNSFIGLMTEPVVITVAIAGLALVAFPKGFLRVAHVIYGLGLIFALWLLSQSFFVIKAFCPWCLLVTVSTITVFSTMSRIVIMENVWNLSESLHEKAVNFLEKGWGRVIYSAIYSFLAIAIILKYGNQIF
ncbi:MAG: vitamin K epoxide reductase family protein [Actinomycetales bacterium]|nr:vitamin K epoxide reductase family protein [Actinomycetales bacterium]